jgi:GH24 family phage-related lysozyme (muramidase)
MEEVKERIKQHEGFRRTVYSDSLGFATIGYGHLLLPTDNFVEGVEYSKEELEAVFDNDFQIALTSAEELLEEIEAPETVKGIICEMCFQLGKPRTMKFKKMWEGIEEADYNKAADEMIDSNWHKQTTARCEDLAELMRSCS